MSQSALAATASTTFLVTATVVDYCLVVATPLVMGNYNASSSTPLDASSTISVTCSLGTAYAIALDSGTGTGASFSNRKLTSGGNTLNYNLYDSTARTTVWGDGTGSSVTRGGTGSGLVQAFTVHGRIAALQNINIGAYTDLITVTVTY